MKRIVALILLIPTTSTADEPAAGWMERSFKLESLELRARPRRPARLALSPGGATIGKADPERELIVLEASADDTRIRVVTETPLLRIASFADPRDLQRVARDGAVLTAAREPGELTDASPGTHLRAGVELEPGKGGRATFRQSDLLATGYLRPGMSGHTFKPGGPATDDFGDDKLDWVDLKCPVDFLDAPHGARLAHLGGKRAAVARRETRGDQALVELQLFDAVVVGWVPARKILPAEDSEFRGREAAGHHVAYAGLPTPDPATAVELHEGELLHETPAGPPVAVVLKAAQVAGRGPAGDGWEKVLVQGPTYEPLVLVRKKP